MTTLRVLHLSDTHLYGDESRHYGVVDTTAHLELTLARFADTRFDLVVCSGDVSEDGSVAAYERAHSMIGSWAAARGARAVFAMGNHDDRENFRAVLGEGQPGMAASTLIAPAGTTPARTAPAGTAPAAGGERTAATGPRPVASAATLSGWRTIVLDTSVPGAGYGEISADQLDFLDRALASPAALGSVIVMHHPPVAAETDLLQALALGEESAARLWECVVGRDVKAILCGHYHHTVFETVHGIPVIVAPGVTNLAEAFGPRSEESARDWIGAAAIEISEDRVRVLPLGEPVTGGQVFRFTESQVRDIITAAGRPAPGEPG